MRCYGDRGTARRGALPVTAPRRAAAHCVALVVLVVGAARSARAQEPVSDPPGDGVVLSVPLGEHPLEITLGGWIETGFTWSFAQPWNGVIAWRGFDNRHATFALSNVVLRTRFEYQGAYVAAAVQWGATPDTYYLAEPAAPAVAGVGASSAATYRFLQEAYVGWAPSLGSGSVPASLAIEAGLFLSPIGIESMAIRSNLHWSRSNLFYGLPFYHLGLRVVATWGTAWTTSLAVVNGWNSVLDANDEKSVAAWVDYAEGDVALRILYFGGVERVGGDWRSLLDAWVRYTPAAWLELALHGNGGFEPIAGAVGWWIAGAFYVAVTPLAWLSIAARADVFLDRAPGDDPALRIFWPQAPWMSSQTITARFVPEEHVSFYVEYRHDHTASSRDLGGTGPVAASFFTTDRVIAADGTPLPTANSQDTVTLGATAGF